MSVGSGQERSVAEDLVLVRHEDLVGPGWLTDAVAVTDRLVHPIRIDRGDDLPSVPAMLDADASVVVLGGFMGAHQDDVYPWLEPEMAWLRQLVAADVPVLGICLGAQLLAAALGGRAFRSEVYECGYPVITLTPAGRADPVLRHLDGPVLSWHEDTFTLPPDAELLAWTDVAPQAFRIGSALGVQFHPEADPAIVEDWIAHVGEATMRARGADPDLLRSTLALYACEVEHAGRSILDAWLATLASRH
jgi:GMP synthase (glutamine-hydrolysing)